MDVNREQLLRDAVRRAQRARRTTGRIVVSAIGVGLAYYFDPESGGVRRRRLRDSLRRTARHIDAAFDPNSDTLAPMFSPLLRGLPQEPPTAETPWAGAR
jgi:hypothetical protein